MSRAPLATGGLALAGLVLALAACRSAPPTADYTSYRSAQDPVTTISRIADGMRDCWFGDRDPAFAEYIYAPELNSFSGKPRVLVVAKSDPGGLPKLVVEAQKAESGTEVRLFGPLLATGAAPMIRQDVGRWAGGAATC